MPRYAGRGRLLADSLRALQLLRTGRWRVDELAAELGVDRRTTYRILQGWEAAGVPIERKRESRTEVYLRVTRASVERALGLR